MRNPLVLGYVNPDGTATRRADVEPGLTGGPAGSAPAYAPDAQAVVAADVLDGPRVVDRDRRFGYVERSSLSGPTLVAPVADPAVVVRYSLRVEDRVDLYEATGAEGTGPTNAPAQNAAARVAALERVAEAKLPVDVFLGAAYLGRYVFAALRVVHRDAAARRFDVDVDLLSLGPAGGGRPHPSASSSSGPSAPRPPLPSQ